MNHYDYPFNRPGYWNGCVPPNNTGTVVIRGNRDSESEETDSIGEPEQRTSPVENLAFYYHTDHLGSTNLVTDRGRSICHATEYLPYGEVFVDLQTSGSDPDLPFKFNGKEMDPETGMLYYGARYYMPKYCQWPTCDPMQLKYPGVSSYAYCMGNPINRIDPDGMDWYQDTDGTYQYSPNVHSQKNLSKGQIYLWKEKNLRKNGIFYRKDGSILFSNESKAYERMWSQADVHYRKGKEAKSGREIGGFILKNGGVLVLPEYFNDRETSAIDMYGYKVTRQGTLMYGKERFSIVGQIHTHQDRSYRADPSYIGGKGDLGLSIQMGGLPFIVIGHDKLVRAIYSVGDNKYSTIKIGNRQDLINGKIKLQPWLKTYPTK